MSARYGSEDAALRQHGPVTDILEYFETWAHHRHHHETSAETPAAAVTIEPTTGGPVSAFTDTMHAVAARLEKFDEEAIARLEAVQGSDVTRELFGVIAGLTRVDPTPEFNAVVTLLKAFAPQQPIAPEPVPSYSPAGPQVAGQA